MNEVLPPTMDVVLETVQQAGAVPKRAVGAVPRDIEGLDQPLLVHHMHWLPTTTEPQAMVSNRLCWSHNCGA